MAGLKQLLFIAIIHSPDVFVLLRQAPTANIYFETYANKKILLTLFAFNI